MPGLEPSLQAARSLEDCYRWYRDEGLAEHPWDFAYEDRAAAALRQASWPPLAP